MYEYSAETLIKGAFRIPVEHRLLALCRVLKLTGQISLTAFRKALMYQSLWVIEKPDLSVKYQQSFNTEARRSPNLQPIRFEDAVGIL